MPGFALAKRCADAFELHARAGKHADVIVLERHGIFTFGDSAKESYGRMIAGGLARGVVHRGRAPHRRPGRDRRPPGVCGGRRPPRAPRRPREARGGAGRAGPDPRSPRASDAVLAFLARPDAEELASIGCATPDHVIRTKPTPLFLRLPPPAGGKVLAVALEEQIVAYAARYDAYFAEMCAAKAITRTKLDPWPRVVLVPGVGLLAVGQTSAEARIAADIYEHTLDVLDGAADVGRYTPVSPSDLFDVEYWSLEQAKLKKAAARPLAQAIALVTGAASGIGRATAATLLGLGAHVVLVDRDRGRLEEVWSSFPGETASRVAWTVADVTSVAAVDAAFAHASRVFGGVDLVVSNAGNAPIGDLHEPEADRLLRDSLELNLLAHNHVARAAVQVFRAQGRGGCLLFNVSKAAFAPGPHFGPYAVAKAALLALMRQYAIDAAPFGVRANAVNADRIRTALFGGGVAKPAPRRGASASTLISGPTSSRAR